MLILQWCKTQIMCLMILAYIEIIYTREGNSLNRFTKRSNCNLFFDLSLVVVNFAVVFDGITACTVNLLELVPQNLNLLLHLGMYLSYELFAVLLFWYWISVNGRHTQRNVDPGRMSAARYDPGARNGHSDAGGPVPAGRVCELLHG